MGRKCIEVAKICSCLILLASFAASATILSESEQVSLEVSRQLLPTNESSNKVRDHLIEIRYVFPAVAKVFHGARWRPGVFIVPGSESVKSIDMNMDKINDIGYGPISRSKPLMIFPDTLLAFNKPYNPETLGRIIEERYGFKYGPYLNMNPLRNEISYIDVSAPSVEGERTRVYTFKKVWQFHEGIYTHIWEIKIKKLKYNYVVTLEKEYGDNLIE